MKLVQRSGYYEYICWFASILFFFFAGMKLRHLLMHGFVDYDEVVRVLGLPSQLRYYGAVAVVIEFFFAIGIWYKASFKISNILLMGMAMLGIALSTVIILYKIEIDCQCGLFGKNEVGFLVQKLLIIILAIYLLRSERRLTSQ